MSIEFFPRLPRVVVGGGGGTIINGFGYDTVACALASYISHGSFDLLISVFC